MRRGERGFTYVGLLVVIVLIGVLLAAAGEVAATAAQREREAQLLWVGHEYRGAIARYWARTRRYPPSLKELLGSAPDAPVQVRFLRQLYPDPMTSAVDWVLVPAPDGSGIMGVASSSKRAPLKTAQFDPVDQDFDKAVTYGDWQFTFLPVKWGGAPYQAPARAPAAAPRPASAPPPAPASPPRTAPRSR